MKLSEKIDGRIRRQGWFRLGGRLDIGHGLAQRPGSGTAGATPLATAGESVIAPELAQAHPVIAPVPLEQAAESRRQAQVRRYLPSGLTQ